MDMFAYTLEYQPYIENGRIYLPEQTINLLIDKGIEPRIADYARNGMALSEMINMDAIHNTFSSLLSRLSEQDIQRNAPVL